MKLQNICSKIAKDLLPIGTEVTLFSSKKFKILEIINWACSGDGVWHMNMQSKDGGKYSFRSHNLWRKA